MAQSNVITVAGVVRGSPATSALFTPTAFEPFLDLALEATYGSVKATQRSVNVDAAHPEALPLEGITKARFLAFRLLSGSTMQIWLTTALGVAKIPVSDEFVLHVPNPGDEVTAIQLVGTADFSYLIAGDVT